MPLSFYSIRIIENKYEPILKENFSINGDDNFDLYLSDYLFEAIKQLLISNFFFTNRSKDNIGSLLNKINNIDEIKFEIHNYKKVSINYDNKLIERTKILMEEIAKELNENGKN